MYPTLKTYINELKSRFGSISEERKEKLRMVSDYIRSRLESGETARLNFICTHNSRRSHLAQIWTSVATHHFGLEKIETYSGGTEATAFNPRAVSALQRSGLIIENPGGDNPTYKVKFSDDIPPLICFSKRFDDETNPKDNFAAIMTCSDADENCPFVPGTDFRQAITYRDPKESDETPEESKIYDERCRQIASEMFYMMSQL